MILERSLIRLAKLVFVSFLGRGCEGRLVGCSVSARATLEFLSHLMGESFVVTSAKLGLLPIRGNLW